MIFNLCQERSYDIGLVEGNVEIILVEDREISARI